MKDGKFGGFGFRFGFLVTIFLLFAIHANAAIFTVTNTSDSGAGSLRQAITDANGATGIDTIAFNIPGSGVKKIAPLTELPTIIGGAIIIDGTTQPGWSVGNLVIEISGENLTGASAYGIKFNAVSASAQSFVRGLVINRFSDSGIYIQDSRNITVEGCFIGTDATGTIDRGNGIGVETRVGSSSTENITIGGTTAATRNLISGNVRGIRTFGGSDFTIIGNYIGTNVGGNSALPNIFGISLGTQTSIIGGATAAERNVISGNTGSGVIVDTNSNTIQNNYIGVGADGFTPLGNDGDGVRVINSINLVITGNHLITGNIIANNTNEGIEILGNFNNPTGNRISANSIYNNTNGFGAAELGIDFEGDGVTPNDAGDADAGPNNLQNFPVLTSANVGTSATQIQGTLNSEAGTSYRIEFFANNANLREGKTFLGFQNVTTDSNGEATINATVSATALSNQYVTATATRNAAPLDTSEFSAPIPVSVETFVVTNTNNSGTGSLRQAITDANANANPNLITFAITPLDGSVKTINLTLPLPTITSPVAIDALTQSGATCAAPKVELNGTNAGAGGDGFFVTANNVLLQGFIINRFSGDGIVLDSNNTNTIRCNKIGTNAAGSAAAANGASGILLDTSSLNLIEKNTFSGNGVSGIRGLFAQYNTIQGNIVGLSSDGTTVIPNVSGGILLLGGLNNIVGGTTAEKRNVISGNGLAGLVLSNSAANSVKGNYIGVDASGGGTIFGNTGPGIIISTSFGEDNIIGGTETGAANVIAFNTTDGISFAGNAGTSNRISGNAIHDNGNLAIDIGDDGVTANDAGDADAGANNQQNFPVISAAETFFGGLKVTGSLNSAANTSFRIEVYANPTCDASGNGEGRNFLGSFEVVTNGSGNANFSQSLTSTGVALGDSVAATATRNTPPFDTSEFSACRTTTALSIPTLTVTNTNDSGAGSLRQAIINANSGGGANQIIFNIPGSGVKTITPATALPPLTAPVIIDGLSQPGSTCAAPLIEINGTNAGANSDGLHVSASGDIRGLIINRFNGDGIEFDTAGGNIVKCSWIGVDNTGLNAAGNGLQGLHFNRVGNNVVGGTSNDGNVISANNTRNSSSLFDGGIYLFLSNNNIVQGNVIGLNKNGLRGNINFQQNYGILMINSDNNQIGGMTAAARNTISFNDIGIKLENSDQNVFQGNYIGVESTGNLSAGLNSLNGRGIYISGTSVENMVGGAEIGAGNVISNNSIAGVEVFGTDGSQLIQGNLIGTDATGTFKAGNQQNGIAVNYASSITIGGRAAAERNVISGNVSSGIIVDNDGQPETGFNTVIEGNYIGLAGDGTTVIAGQTTGIRIVNGANANRIGGTATGAGNVISGNTSGGISIATRNNLVQGNFIGTDASGTISKPNNTGIILSTAAATENIIGGTTAAMRNIISGNTTNGILLGNGASANSIFNNYIGVAPNATTALANNDNGILLDGATGNFIGNSIATGNVISGNGESGIIFTGGANNNFVQGNLIGTNAAGTGDLGNVEDGIEFFNLFPVSTGNIIGGANSAQRNVISGNNRNGVNLSFSSQNNAVQNNLIGTQVDGASPLGNASFGVSIDGISNTIGGANAGNTIAFNVVGVRVGSVTSTGNRISANSIFSNTSLGIDLGSVGIAPNDAGDGDTGTNNLQNYPLLSSANGTIVQGTFNSTASSTFTLEFFLNPTSDSSNFGEGQIYLGALNITTNVSGNANFTFTAPVNLPNGQFISATATDANGNTSEFSQVRQILAPTVASVSVQGRVLNETGRGIFKAIITMTDANGNVRTAMTNPFGYYRFLEVRAGETYIFTVSHKTHRFVHSTQILTISEELENLNFVGTRGESAPDIGGEKSEMKRDGQDNF